MYIWFLDWTSRKKLGKRLNNHHLTDGNMVLLLLSLKCRKFLLLLHWLLSQIVSTSKTARHSFLIQFGGLDNSWLLFFRRSASVADLFIWRWTRIKPLYNWAIKDLDTTPDHPQKVHQTLMISIILLLNFIQLGWIVCII